MATKLALDALMMAVWRSKPKKLVIMHTDQAVGSVVMISNIWCNYNRHTPSMNRRGNCYNNAVTELFFRNLKKDRIKRKIYPTRGD